MIASTSRSAALLLALASGVTAAAAQPATDLDGRWDASLLNNGPTVPFRLDISGAGPSLKGTFWDGFHPYDGTTSASWHDGQLVLKSDHYLTTINAALKDGALVGTAHLQGPGYALKYDFRAQRHVDVQATATNVPQVAGTWVLPLETPSSKGEKAWRFIVQQQGADVAASILRVDGDTGAYSGTYRDGKWILGHFDGSRPGVLELTPLPDGTLRVVPHYEALLRAFSGDDGNHKDGGADGKGYEENRFGPAAPKLTGYREDVAVARGLPQPENYETHTTVRDPNERFTFNFPDVDGKPVSNEDPRFKDKVVLAIVTGTWCPNCHDEAQYLVELDRKYRDRGLAIVALDFEEPEQQASLERERAFVKQYGVQYTYLIAGAPSEMWEKVPQAVNLNTWPATLFVGRDGRVRSIHSGFASPASGEFNEQLKREFTTKIEQLLAENRNASLANTL